MTTMLENKYIEPELRHIEISRFDIRKEKEEYHKEQIDIEEKESDKFTSLVESIRELGILQPIYVIEKGNNDYEVVDGGRRLRAARFLHLKTVPSMVFQGGYDETEIRKRALIANIQRKDLSLEEKGEGLAEYYRSGGVNPEHAIDYLNTLRSRKLRNTRNRGISTGHYKKEDPEEFSRFSDLEKRLGIPRMTQYAWLKRVVFIPKEIRKSKEFQQLPKKDQEILTQSEVRDKPKTQASIVDVLAEINKEFEKAKENEKKEAVGTTVQEVKEKKKEKLKEYFPNTENKKKAKPKTPFKRYGEINGQISKLWKSLLLEKTLNKEMPNMTDDLINDYIKPTRDDFKEYIAGLGIEQRTQQYNWLAWLSDVIDDRMNLLDKATGK